MRSPFSKFHVRSYPADAGFLIIFFIDARTGMTIGPAIIRMRNVPQNLFFPNIRNNFRIPRTRLPAMSALTTRFSEKPELVVPRFLFMTLEMDAMFDMICLKDSRVRFINRMVEMPRVLPTDVKFSIGWNNRFIGL